MMFIKVLDLIYRRSLILNYRLNRCRINAGLFQFTYQNNRQTQVDVVCIGFLDFL